MALINEKLSYFFNLRCLGVQIELDVATERLISHHCRIPLVCIFQSTQTKAGVKAESDFRHRVGQLLLDQLVCSQGSSELLPVHRVLPGGGKAELSGTQNTPGDAKPSNN